MQMMMFSCVAVLASLGRANADGVLPFEGVRHGRGVAVARDGVVYVGGATEESADHGGASKLRPQLVALAPDHRVLWTKRWDDLAIVTSVVTDQRGPVVSLLLRGPSFDAGCPGAEPIERGTREVAVVLALTSDGSCRWSRTFAASGIAIAIAPAATIAVAPLPAYGQRATITYLDGRGGIVREVKLPAGIAPQHMTANDRQLFITGTAGKGWIGALDAGGALQWTTTIAVAKDSVVIPFEISADSEHVVIAGLFRGSVRFDEHHERHSSDADDDSFVARYDVRGNLGWVYTYGAPSSDQVRGVALVGHDTYAVANRTEGARLGGDAMLYGDTQVFLIRLDDGGVPRDARALADRKLGSYPSIYIDTMVGTADRLYVIGDTHEPTRSFGDQLSGETALLFDLGL